MTESLPPTTPAAPTAGAGDKAPVSTGPKPLGAPMGARPGGRPSFGGPRSGPGGPRSGPGGRPTGPGGRGRRPPPRRKVCRFCAEKISEVDYKAIPILRGFLTARGKILSGRTTGNCAGHQRQLTQAIKRAQTLALLPYTGE
ncbi:MAG: 30S ribosomal protein S18 [Elusimicrobia bacterium]|nr:30S ribosomal protein S18 [Elusimicrobiota bacterium]